MTATTDIGSANDECLSVVAVIGSTKDERLSVVAVIGSTKDERLSVVADIGSANEESMKKSGVSLTLNSVALCPLAVRKE